MSKQPTIYNQLRLEGKLCDAVIRVEDAEFKVRRVILFMCSPYFRDLFARSQDRVFNISSLSPEMMQLIIEYAYTGSVDVKKENVQELLLAADQLNVMDIVKICCHFLEEHLCPENCISTWQFTNISPELRSKAYSYIVDNWEKVASSEEFLQLPVQDLADILGKDELNVNHESTVFEMLMKWMNHVPEERKQHLPLLLSKTLSKFCLRPQPVVLMRGRFVFRNQHLKTSQHFMCFITFVPRYRREHIFYQDVKRSIVCLFKMVKENSSENSVATSEVSHRCGPLCLGPLTFHSQAVGDMVHLSQGGRLAERTEGTFRNGLVFSNRPVKVQERIRLRVQRDVFNFHGALRVGFTNVSPSARSLPLPSMAIPNLTSSPGHWAAPVHESCCEAGSELEFWVSAGGSVYITGNNSSQHRLLTGVDLSQPLWAMIDIYGQTCSIFLLGSEKKGLLWTKRSCPAPEALTSADVHSHYSSVPDVSDLSEDSEDSISCLDMEISEDSSCVVCMVKEARVTLPCGHRCLCHRCVSKVCQRFGTCPLCRQKIGAPSVEGRCVSVVL